MLTRCGSTDLSVWPHAFCIMSPRVIICSKVKSLSDGAEAKASVKSAFELHVMNPKLSELPMARMNLL